MAFAEHLIRLKNGRTLAVAETGDPQGAPTLFCHPAPGSRLLTARTRGMSMKKGS